MEVGKWRLLLDITQTDKEIASEIEEIIIGDNECGEIIWTGHDSGELSTKAIHNFYRSKVPVAHWKENLWRPYLPPKISLLAWQILKK